MTAQGGDILAWLETAIREREEVARAATAGPWEETGIGDYGWTVSAPSGAIVETSDSDQGRADARHVAVNDPESVLRRCAADRKLLELHRPIEMTGEMADACATCEVDGNYPYYPCRTVRLLAEGYGRTGEQ